MAPEPKKAARQVYRNSPGAGAGNPSYDKGMAQNNTGSLVWFIAGAAIGASITLLYAPQSGKDTRRLLSKKARRGSDAIADAGRDALDKGRELYEKGLRVADEAAELFERGRRLVEG
jgi:hypothetical protein